MSVEEMRTWLAAAFFYCFVHNSVVQWDLHSIALDVNDIVEVCKR